ncbi:11400_t:CDS:1, partial [Funneliformis caledonium]
TIIKTTFSLWLDGCFDMTKVSTSSYIEYLEHSTGLLFWRDIVDMLWFITASLNVVIHETYLIHGQLHGRNILVKNEADSIDTRIADYGLHGPVDKPSQKIYGVIPFVVSEIFLMEIRQQRNLNLQFRHDKVDISAGVYPYYDLQLVQGICYGLR